MWSAREDSASERSICSMGATAASSASTAISITITRRGGSRQQAQSCLGGEK